MGSNRRFISEQEKKWRDLTATLLPSAKSAGKKECTRCGRPCWIRPGLLTKADLNRLAGLYALSAETFFTKYCMVDDISGNYHVILRRKHQKGGMFISHAQSYSIESPCVFLDEANNLCTIHENKPEQCGKYACWENVPDSTKKYAWVLSDIEALGYNHISPFQKLWSGH